MNKVSRINSTPPVDLERYRSRIQRTDLVKQNGKVTQVIGLVIESSGPNAMVGEICHIYYDRANHYDPTRPPIKAEVVGFRESGIIYPGGSNPCPQSGLSH